MMEDSKKMMTKEEILKQLPDEFEKLSLLGKVTGPPTSEDYNPVVVKEKKSLWRSFRDKFNPFVPLGLAATVFFLANGLRHMVKRNSAKSQMMMRGRITAQGFTVMALVGGMFWEAEKKRKKALKE